MNYQMDPFAPLRMQQQFGGMAGPSGFAGQMPASLLPFLRTKDGKHIGVMADEVAADRPDALGPTVNGMQTVDYGQLDAPAPGGGMFGAAPNKKNKHDPWKMLAGMGLGGVMGGLLGGGMGNAAGMLASPLGFGSAKLLK